MNLSALMVRRAEKARLAEQLAVEVQHHLDNPSAASRQQLRWALIEYRAVDPAC